MRLTRVSYGIKRLYQTREQGWYKQLTEDLGSALAFFTRARLEMKGDGRRMYRHTGLIGTLFSMFLIVTTTFLIKS